MFLETSHPGTENIYWWIKCHILGKHTAQTWNLYEAKHFIPCVFHNIFKAAALTLWLISHIKTFPKGKTFYNHFLFQLRLPIQTSVGQQTQQTDLKRINKFSRRFQRFLADLSKSGLCCYCRLCVFDRLKLEMNSENQMVCPQVPNSWFS